MFANRYTALIDACVLAGALKRNLLLTLAEAEFFRLRWSERILRETEDAIVDILSKKGVEDAVERGARAIASMSDSFEDAMVSDYERFLCACDGLPDQEDAHIVAAALKTEAATIVTDNIKHFPLALLTPLNLEVRTADEFIADTIALDQGKAVFVIRTMRERFKNPAVTGSGLLLLMEKSGLHSVVNVLRTHEHSL